MTYSFLELLITTEKIQQSRRYRTLLPVLVGIMERHSLSGWLQGIWMWGEEEEEEELLGLLSLCCVFLLFCSGGLAKYVCGWRNWKPDLTDGFWITRASPVQIPAPWSVYEVSTKVIYWLNKIHHHTKKSISLNNYLTRSGCWSPAPNLTIVSNCCFCCFLPLGLNITSYTLNADQVVIRVIRLFHSGNWIVSSYQEFSGSIQDTNSRSWEKQ